MNRRICIFACLIVCLVLATSLASAKKKISSSDIDNLRDALTVSAGQSYKATAANISTAEAGEPAHTCYAGTRPSVWFKYKADRDIAVNFSTEGSHFPYDAPYQGSHDDTVMSIYVLASGTPNTATFANLGASQCNDDAYQNDRYSGLTVDVDAGKWYFIRLTPYNAFALPAGSSYALNVGISNLIENGEFQNALTGGEWTLTGKGKGDDSYDCSIPADCDIKITHSPLGPTKLTQSIDNFKGVTMPVGTGIYATAELDYGGFDPKTTMMLKVFYTDGTSKTVKKKIDTLSPTRVIIGGSYSMYLSLTIEKPVAKVMIRFIDKTTTQGWTFVDEVHLVGEMPGGATRALPLPASPK
jgi:hypothetical protein